MKARTRIIVLNQFQRWFLLNFIGYTALFLSVFGIGLFIWLKLVANELFHVAGLLSSTFVATIQKHMTYGLWVSILLVLTLLALAGCQALFFSRKIAGPIFALSRHLDICAQKGELTPLQLRDEDLFVEVAEKFNKLAETVNKKTSR